MSLDDLLMISKARLLSHTCDKPKQSTPRLGEGDKIYDRRLNLRER